MKDAGAAREDVIQMLIESYGASREEAGNDVDECCALPTGNGGEATNGCYRATFTAAREASQSQL